MFDSIWVNTVCIVFIPYFLLRVCLRFEVWSCLIGFEGLDFRFSLWRDILVVEWLWLLWFTMIVFIPYFVLGVCLRFGVWSCLIAFEGLDFGFRIVFCVGGGWWTGELWMSLVSVLLLISNSTVEWFQLEWITIALILGSVMTELLSLPIWHVDSCNNMRRDVL